MGIRDRHRDREPPDGNRSHQESIFSTNAVQREESPEEEQQPKPVHPSSATSPGAGGDIIPVHPSSARSPRAHLQAFGAMKPGRGTAGSRFLHLDCR